MATPTTDLDLVNMALSHLGHTVEVSVLATDTTIEAKTARKWIDTERQILFAEFRWRWAEKRAVLAEVTGTGAWWDAVHDDWLHAYTAPGSMAQAREVWPGTRNPAPEDAVPFLQTLDAAGTATVILTDADPVASKAPVLAYTALLTTVSLYPQPFVDFFVKALAVRLAMPLTKDRKLYLSMLQERAAAFVRAARFDLEGHKPDQPPPSPSLRARGSTRRLGQVR